jgi:hypothetical protein
MENHCRLFSEDDVRRVRILRELTPRHIQPSRLRRQLPRLATYEYGYLLLDSGKVTYCLDERRVLKLAAAAGGPVLLIQIGDPA